MAKKYPALGEALEQQPANEKNEILGMSKAIEIADIVVVQQIIIQWESRDNLESVCNHNSLNFSLVDNASFQISDKLRTYQMTTAKCKKTFEKYFKKKLEIDLNGPTRV